MSTSTTSSTTMNSTTTSEDNQQQQQQETRQNLFHNLVFYISGSLLQMKQCEMNDLLIRHGATVINHSTNKNFYQVTHVLATEKTYNRQTVAIRRAKAHPHIHIVHESFVYDSVKKNQLQNEKLYQFESNTNNNNNNTNISEQQQQQQSPVMSTSLSSTSSPSSSTTTTTTTTIPSIPPYSASSLPIRTYNPTSGPYLPSYYTDVYNQTQHLNANNNNNPINNNNNNMTNNSTTNNITSNLRTVNSARNTPATTTTATSSSSSSSASTNGRNGSASSSSSSTSNASRMRPVAPEQRKQPAATDKLLVSNVIMMLQEQVQCQSSLLKQREETIENLQRELIVRKRKRDHRSPSSSSKTGKQQQVNHHLHVHLRISNYDKDGGMKTLGGDRMEDEEEWRVAHEFNSDSDDDDDVFSDDDDNEGDNNDDENDENDGVTCSPNKLPRLITQLDDELVSTFFCSHRIDDLYDWQVHDSSKDIYYKMVTCNRARIQPISNICYEDEMQVSALALVCKMEQSLAHPTIRNSTLPVWYPFMMVARSELISQKHMSLKNFVCTEKRILRLMQISLGVQDIWSPQFKRIDDHECLFLEDNANSSDELHKKERQLLIKGGNELKRKCSILFEITFPCDYVRFPHFIGGVLEEDQHIIVGAFCTKYAAPQNTN